MFGGMIGGALGSLAQKVKGAAGGPGLKRKTEPASLGSKAGAMSQRLAKAKKSMTGQRSVSRY